MADLTPRHSVREIQFQTRQAFRQRKQPQRGDGGGRVVRLRSQLEQHGRRRAVDQVAQALHSVGVRVDAAGPRRLRRAGRGFRTCCRLRGRDKWRTCALCRPATRFRAAAACRCRYSGGIAGCRRCDRLSSNRLRDSRPPLLRCRGSPPNRRRSGRFSRIPVSRF